MMWRAGWRSVTLAWLWLGIAGCGYDLVNEEVYRARVSTVLCERLVACGDIPSSGLARCVEQTLDCDDCFPAPDALEPSEAGVPGVVGYVDQLTTDDACCVLSSYGENGVGTVARDTCGYVDGW